MLGTITKAYPVEDGSWDLYIDLDDGGATVTCISEEERGDWAPTPGDRIDITWRSVSTITRI